MSEERHPDGSGDVETQRKRPGNAIARALRMLLSPLKTQGDDRLLAIRERYLPFRALSMQVNHEVLVKRVFDGRLDEAAKKLGMRAGKTLLFDSEAEMPILMDFAIHSVLRGGRNLVDECLTDTRAAFTSEQMDVLNALGAAHYAVLTVERTEPGFGLYCLDTSLNPPVRIFLADQSLSQTTVPGKTVATRIVPVDDFFLTAGAALLVRGEAVRPFDLAYVRHQESRIAKRGSWTTVSRQEDAALAGLLVPLLLRHGASSHVVYAGADDELSPDLLSRADANDGPLENASGHRLSFRREGSKVGRNDPCPCGSGKKLKKCCGAKA